jgi:hypothetical protein
MSFEVLKLIIMMCSINALEDSRSNWTELPKIEKYQRNCRVWYIDCYKRKEGNDRLIQCIKERNP